jgi:hypothetical protein
MSFSGLDGHPPHHRRRLVDRCRLSYGLDPLGPYIRTAKPGWTACGARASGIEGSLADRRAAVEAELTDAGSGNAGDGVTSQRRGVAFSHSRDPAFRAL